MLTNVYHFRSRIANTRQVFAVSSINLETTHDTITRRAKLEFITSQKDQESPCSTGETATPC